MLIHCAYLVNLDSTILTPKDGLPWSKLLVNLAPSSFSNIRLNFLLILIKSTLFALVSNSKLMPFSL